MKGQEKEITAKEKRGWCETTFSEINVKNYLKIWIGITNTCKDGGIIYLSGGFLSCELWPTNTLCTAAGSFHISVLKTLLLTPDQSADKNSMASLYHCLSFYPTFLTGFF